jgi:ATP synthase protein I
MVEPTEKRDSGTPEPAMVSVARYSGLGLQLAASVVVFMLAGRWLDGKLGTGSWLTLMGALIGGAAGFYSLYRHLVKSADRGRRG